MTRPLRFRTVVLIVELQTPDQAAVVAASQGSYAEMRI